MPTSPCNFASDEHILISVVDSLVYTRLWLIYYRQKNPDYIPIDRDHAHVHPSRTGVYCSDSFNASELNLVLHIRNIQCATTHELCVYEIQKRQGCRLVILFASAHDKAVYVRWSSKGSITSPVPLQSFHASPFTSSDPVSRGSCCPFLGLK